MTNGENTTRFWVQMAATVILAGATAFASAMMTRSRDMERVVTVEAKIEAQAYVNRGLELRLMRIEDKLDRVIEGRAPRRNN